MGTPAGWLISEINHRVICLCYERSGCTYTSLGCPRSVAGQCCPRLRRRRSVQTRRSKARFREASCREISPVTRSRDGADVQSWPASWVWSGRVGSDIWRVGLGTWAMSLKIDPRTSPVYWHAHRGRGYEGSFTPPLNLRFYTDIFSNWVPMAPIPASATYSSSEWLCRPPPH